MHWNTAIIKKIIPGVIGRVSFVMLYTNGYVGALKTEC